MWCHKLITNASLLDWKHKFKVEIRYEQQVAWWCEWSNADPPDTTEKGLFLKAVGWRGLWNWKKKCFNSKAAWLPGTGLLYVTFEYLNYKTWFRWADPDILNVQWIQRVNFLIWFNNQRVSEKVKTTMEKIWLQLFYKRKYQR